MMNYGREVVMEIHYRKGGPEVLKDKAEMTSVRTGKKYQLHYSINYGATGKWESRDRANHCSMRITEADGPDFKPGDNLQYGKDSSIEVVSAEWSWADRHGGRGHRQGCAPRHRQRHEPEAGLRVRPPLLGTGAPRRRPAGSGRLRAPPGGQGVA
jgi:hypothetical protein